MDLNKVMLIGRVGAKPECKKTQAGDAMSRMRVATSRAWEQDGVLERETEWHTVIAFGKTAEICEKLLDKGKLVYVEGTLRSHEWTDKEGKPRTDREVKAREVIALDPPPRKQGEAVATLA
jgi:single-strand DNA-binding protein